MSMDRDTNVVEVYDPGEDSWERRADMPTPRHGHAAVVVNGKILVVGGYRLTGSLTPLSTVEEYDPVLDRWTVKADMPTPRGFLGVAVAKGHVYALAGRLPRVAAPPVERYDLGNNTWVVLDTMPEGFRNRFGVATVNDMIYVLGGEFQVDSEIPVSVLRYEPEDGR
jgi:N-acetylneuraminic acid mutarotase